MKIWSEHIPQEVLEKQDEIIRDCTTAINQTLELSEKIGEIRRKAEGILAKTGLQDRECEALSKVLDSVDEMGKRIPGMLEGLASPIGDFDRAIGMPYNYRHTRELERAKREAAPAKAEVAEE